MRGNEPDGRRRRGSTPRKFSIPMRGNEVGSDAVRVGQFVRVFDPHEG